MLNFLERMKMKSMLKECDYELAQRIIHEKFDMKSAPYDIADRVEDFLLNPCYKTAKKLVDLDPIFAFYFKECSGDGLYIRKYKQQQEQERKSAQAETAAAVETEDAFDERRAMLNHSVSQADKQPSLQQTTASKTAVNGPAAEMESEHQTSAWVRASSMDAVQTSTSVKTTASPSKPVVASISEKEEVHRDERVEPDASKGEQGGFLSRARTKAKKFAAEKLDVDRSKASQPQKPEPESHSQPAPIPFDNVISTLRKDMEQLEQEIERTKIEMENDFAKREEGEKWVQTCERALLEFREAVRILESAGK